ncbi:MAG: hypothetical protein KBC53_00125 [Nitrosomonas sp.]|nr:hypothetical protein [Nitrosomonas sp.]
MKVTCQKCGEESHFDMVASVPDEQIVTFTIGYQGDLIAAKTVSCFIEKTSKLLVSVADDVGFKACVFIKQITHEPKKISIDFLVTRIKSL